VPAFDVAQSTQELRARILSERERIGVLHDGARWQQLLRTWDDEAARLHLEVKDREPSTDDVGAFQPMSPPTSNWSSSLGPQNRRKSNGSC